MEMHQPLFLSLSLSSPSLSFKPLTDLARVPVRVDAAESDGPRRLLVRVVGQPDGEARRVQEAAGPHAVEEGRLLHDGQGGEAEALLMFFVLIICVFFVCESGERG